MAPSHRRFVFALLACGLLARPALAGGPTLDRLDQIGPALGACWSAPPGYGDVTVTIRLSLKADGAIHGEPRITFSTPIGDAQRKRRLQSHALQSILDCTPLPLSPSLGRAVAGRIFILRFATKGREIRA